MAENGNEERSGVQAFKAWVQKNHEQQPALGAELRVARPRRTERPSECRPACFSRQHAAARRAGRPLSPTQAMVTKDVGTVYGFQEVLDGYARRGSVHGRGHEQDKGMQDAERGKERDRDDQERGDREK